MDGPYQNGISSASEGILELPSCQVTNSTYSPDRFKQRTGFLLSSTRILKPRLAASLNQKKVGHFSVGLDRLDVRG